MVTDEMVAYKCGLCNREFNDDTPEELKIAEAERNFGRMPDDDDKASLCDDCYKVFMTWFNEVRPDLREKEML